MLSQFHSPRILFGWDSLSEISKIAARRAALVTDKTMQELGIVAQIQERFWRAGAELRVAGYVNREPYVNDVEPLIEALHADSPDAIVALGGGSVMDAAKTAWAFYENPALTWETAFVVNGISRRQGRAQFIAIPTTSGTGSEVSPVAVLIDSATRLKRLVMSPHLVPTLAILDPRLTLTMPNTLTAHAAFDALTHAVEALVTGVTNEFARANALHALRLIFEHLPDAYANGARTAREKLHLAATMASLAISNSFAGLAHGMDQVGPLFHLPHGLVCAVLLPYTMTFNLDAAREAYAEMGAAIGIAAVGTAADSTERARRFLRRVVELQARVSLPGSFQQAGVAERDYFAAMDTLVSAALASRSTQLSPRVPTAAEARSIFENAYWGR